MRRYLLSTVFFFCLISLSLLQGVNASSPNQQLISPYAANLLDLINNYRLYYGLSSLRFDSRLNQLALKHSYDMFRRKRMSHNGFQDRFRRSGRRMCVENVGWNYTTPLKQFDGWRHSRGHDENMLKEDIHYVGIAQVGNYVTFFACR